MGNYSFWIDDTVIYAFLLAFVICFVSWNMRKYNNG
jgi:hypothetical protein